MKTFLKYLLIGLAIFLLVFLSLGYFNPVISYQNNIAVEAIPEAAFKIFNDTSNMKQWIMGLSRIEFVEGEMNAVGSKWKLILDQEGAHYEMLETMTAYEPNRRFAFVLTNEMFTTEVDVRFTPSLQGTIITADNVVMGKNLFWHSFFVIMSSTFSNQSQQMYDNLKLIIDKNQVPA